MEILEKCLKASDNTLSTAADLLSQVKERKVLNELFNSTPGMNKAQSIYVYTSKSQIQCIYNVHEIEVTCKNYVNHKPFANFYWPFILLSITE